MKKQLIQEFAASLHSFGYRVYISKNGEYGFYTDGKRVVSFGSSEAWGLNLSGNYAPSRESGTGWRILSDLTSITQLQAAQAIAANAPAWANKSPVYTTPEKYLATYQDSSNFTEFAA
jgi:hypothetical protein